MRSIVVVGLLALLVSFASASANLKRTARGGGDTKERTLAQFKAPGGKARIHPAILAKMSALHAKKATKNGGGGGEGKHVTLDKKMKVVTAAAATTHKKVKPVARS